MNVNKKVLWSALSAVALTIIILTVGNAVMTNVAISEEPSEIENDPFTNFGVFDRSYQELDLVKQSKIYDPNNKDVIEMTAEPVQYKVNGETIRGFGYNGQIPGPLIRVKQGQEVTINFINKLDQDTTVHWHGLRLDVEFDGVPDLSQDPIKPGESFVYKLKFPDEGLYWYHPHVREDYQQELGLYGAMIVEPTEDDYYNPVNGEEILILDDIYLEEGDVYAFDSDEENLALMGRFGNVMLVNGKTSYNKNVKKGDVVRFYLANSANTRTFRVEVPGAEMKLIGSDGGSYVNEEFVESVVIAPSERYIVEVLFENSGTYELIHETPDKEYVLGEITVSNTETADDYSEVFNTLNTNEYVKEEVKGLSEQHLSKSPDYQITLSIDFTGMMGNMANMPCHAMGGVVMGDCSPEERAELEEEEGEHASEGIEWEDEMPMMNMMMTADELQWKLIDKETGKINRDIDNYDFENGEYVKIRIFNDPESDHPMQHPIHFHGQRFLVLEKDGEENENLVWKDTVLVPIGSTVDILLENTNPGEWMAHCHIAEHAENGMMMTFNVKGGDL